MPSGGPKQSATDLASALLDTSALLASIFEESGSGEVEAALLAGVAMSTVNLAELAARLHQEGWSAGDVAETIGGLGIEVVNFDLEVALLSGKLRPLTRELGLGLGDRACLATAVLQRLPVLTADRVWTELRLDDVEIRCIR